MVPYLISCWCVWWVSGLSCIIALIKEFVGGDVGIHVQDVKGGKSQFMFIRDVCKVIDEVGGVSDVKCIW